MATKTEEKKEERGGVLPLLFFGGLLASGIIYAITQKKSGEHPPGTNQVTFYGWEAEISASGIDYFSVRDQEGGEVRYGPQISVGQLNDGYSYGIYRPPFFFNTSSLAELLDGAPINAAVLSLNCYHDFTPGHQAFNLIMANGQPLYPHDPAQPSDYNRLLYSGVGGRLSTPLRNNAYNDISFVPEAFPWIDPNGLTKLIVMSSRDIEGQPPMSQYEFVILNTSLGGQQVAPKLTVVW